MHTSLFTIPAVGVCNESRCHAKVAEALPGMATPDASVVTSLILGKAYKA